VSVVANVAINVDSRNAASKLRQVQQGAQSTERAVAGLGSAIGKLATAFGAIQAARFVFVKTAEVESQTRSLAILAGSAQKAGQIIQELQQLGAVTPFTSTELIDSAKRLQAFGVEADKVVETTRRLADASGATGAELSGLVTAYGQVQAKGRLQGEELLQFQERGIALQEELRKMYGMTGEEFQKALSKGQVSAKAVEVALVNLTSVGGKYANGAIAQSDTLNGKLSTLQDSFQRLAQNIGTFFEPVFKFLLDGINAFLDRVNNGLRVSAQLKANEQAAIQTVLGILGPGKGHGTPGCGPGKGCHGNLLSRPFGFGFGQSAPSDLGVRKHDRGDRFRLEGSLLSSNDLCRDLTFVGRFVCQHGGPRNVTDGKD